MYLSISRLDRVSVKQFLTICLIKYLITYMLPTEKHYGLLMTQYWFHSELLSAIYE